MPEHSEALMSCVLFTLFSTMCTNYPDTWISGALALFFLLSFQSPRHFCLSAACYKRSVCCRARSLQIIMLGPTLFSWLCVQVAAQAERLAEENLQLKAEIAVLRSQLGYLHRMMLDNNNTASNSSVNGSVVVNGTGEESRSEEQQRNSPSEHPTQYPPAADDAGRTV